MEFTAAFPSPLFSSAAILAAALLLSIFLLLSRRRFPPLPPGPTGIPLLGFLPFLSPDLHTHFASLSLSYGPLMSLRLGSKLAVVVSTPAVARAVLKDQDPVFSNRDVPAAGRVVAYGGADIAWNPLGDTWRMLRRVCVREVLGPASLDAVYHLRRGEVRSTVAHVFAESGNPVDLGAQMFLTVMNVITTTLWGKTVEGAEERSKIGKEFQELVAEITELLGTPNLSDFFPFLERFDLQKIGKKMEVLKERFDVMFAEIIEKRKKKGEEEEEEEEEDFLEVMLKMEKEGGGDDSKTPFTMTHVKALLMDMVVGGTETTSNTMEWAMAEMLQKPEILRRVQAELDQVVGKDHIVEESHTPKLHYLNLVIKEVLRLHPALPLLIPHCPSSPTTINGYYIPKGSRVFVNVWAIQRDPSIWKDPLEFKPERFLEEGKRWDYSGNDLDYFPFGSGRRICAGISMAEKMVSYSLASLLHSFDWKLQEGEEHDLSERFGIVLKKAKPLVAIPTPRLSKPELYC
ncbi:geraniol 8-hydroxylase-like [Typha latifolia]|uniref:geraniol 8-hydroxylase-like n=1 Tax=Typha latifolia TaxID=4733 RepID=UPI003C2AD146